MLDPGSPSGSILAGSISADHLVGLGAVVHIGVQVPNVHHSDTGTDISRRFAFGSSVATGTEVTVVVDWWYPSIKVPSAVPLITAPSD